MTEIPGNGEADEARARLIATARRAHLIEIGIVTMAASLALVLLVVMVVSLFRLEDYGRTNKLLNEQNVKLLERQEQSNGFGVKAVQCVLDQFALHRITNQAVHDRLAAHDKVDPTPTTPLPPMPTDAEVAEDCAPFYRR